MPRADFGWDLPPGVTQRMIDEQSMCTCTECGKPFDPEDDPDAIGINAEICPECGYDANQSI